MEKEINTGKLPVLLLLLCVGLLAGTTYFLRSGKGLDYEKRDYVTAFSGLRPLAEEGNADAQFNLGAMYYAGRGVGQNHTEALKWYRLAARQGVADAQFNLGVMHRKGQGGVAQDYTEAMQWWHKAARQGHANAQFNLGAMYANGEGVPKDNALAYMWMNIAAANGDKEATGKITLLEKEMTSAQIEKAQKRAGECAEKNYKGC